jgi:hypothetical protein
LRLQQNTPVKTSNGEAQILLFGGKMGPHERFFDWLVQMRTYIEESTDKGQKSKEVDDEEDIALQMKRGDT